MSKVYGVFFSITNAGCKVLVGYGGIRGKTSVERVGPQLPGGTIEEENLLASLSREVEEEFGESASLKLNQYIQTGIIWELQRGADK